MRSLRRTLAVRFSFTTFLALLLISLWAFLGTHYSLSRQINESLKSTLQLEAAAFAAQLPALFQPGSNDLDAFVRQVNRFIVLRDSVGSALSANTAFAANLPIDRASFAQALAGQMVIASGSWNGHRFRSLYAKAPGVRVDGGAVIQVAASLRPLVEAERRIFALMLGTVLLGTAATLVGASWLARSAVEPVAAVTAQAQAISPGSKGNRITAHADLAEFKGLVGVLNQMLDRLDGAYLQQRRIIADLGHELRTPLTAMHGEIEVALRGQRTMREYRAVLESCLEEVEHLSSIGEALVLLARIEAGELQPELAPTDVTGLLQDAVRRIGSRAEGRRIVARGPEGGAVVMVDQKMLGLVLDHLLSNTVQHTPSDTRVDLTVSTTKDNVQITVADDGPGIPDYLLPHLFERLYRADQARTRSRGAGLGLTISAAIVEAHDGAIAASRSDLGGLQVTLDLPRVPPAATGAGPRTGPAG
jgi:signal transduction histidine kinase